MMMSELAAMLTAQLLKDGDREIEFSQSVSIGSEEKPVYRRVYVDGQEVPHMSKGESWGSSQFGASSMTVRAKRADLIDGTIYLYSN